MLAKNKDMQKLMDVFSLYEEEQVLPRANVLRYAAKVLESAGEPVPFKVPMVCLSYHCMFVTLTTVLSPYIIICSIPTQTCHHVKLHYCKPQAF